MEDLLPQQAPQRGPRLAYLKLCWLRAHFHRATVCATHIHTGTTTGAGQRRRFASPSFAAYLCVGQESHAPASCQDKYGHTIADVLLLDWTDANHELIKERWCWRYRKYSPDDTEREAREKEVRMRRRAVRWSLANSAMDGACP